MTLSIQPSFSAGEMAPATYARVDLARYYTGLRTCRNFEVMPEGGVQNRSGTRFIAEVKDSSKFTRLIPFQFSSSHTYIIELGNEYIRFYTNGGQVMDSGSPYEIASPYLAADLPNIRFTQSADVLTLVHPDYAPRDLKRLAPTNWQLQVIDFQPTVPAPTGLAATPLSGGSGDTTSYQYRVTAVGPFSAGAIESWPSNTATAASWDSKSGATLAWTAVAGADHYNVYKSKATGVFGYIGQSSGTTFSDKNISPDADKTVPIGYNPFADGNYPGVVGYYQQRKVYAASDKQPQTIWMSRTGDFNNFAYSEPFRADDSIEITLASNQVDRIQHLVALRSLLALTSGAEWAISASADSGITADNISATPQSYVGTNNVTPAVYANTALYVQARGGKLATLAYTYTADGFVPQDVSVLSSHLIRGFELQDMAWCMAPNGIAWMVRNDGQLLGFTFLSEQQVFAWHHHDTDGAFESVASVPEGDEDMLYCIVRRTINGVTKRYVERKESRQLNKFGSGGYNFDRCFFVDSGLTYDGRVAGTGTLTGGTEWKAKELLTLTAAGTPFTAGMVGRSVVMYGGGDADTIGQKLVLEIKGFTSDNQVTVSPNSIVPDSLRGVSASRWGIAALSVSGLSHLEGKTVSILADGNVGPQKVVIGGSINLTYPALVAHIGLPITADFETLDMTTASNQAMLAQRKLINNLTVLVEESRGMWIGPDADNLSEYKQRATENWGEPISLYTGQLEHTPKSKWDNSARVFIRQFDPLPLTILGVIPNVQAGN